MTPAERAALDAAVEETRGHYFEAWPTIDATQARILNQRLAALERAIVARAIAPLVEALERFIDDEECWFDHHGYCQAHSSLEEGQCLMAQARAALAALREGRC